MQSPLCVTAGLPLFAYLAVDNHTPAFSLYFSVFQLLAFFQKRCLKNILMEFTENVFGKIKMLFN